MSVVREESNTTVATYKLTIWNPPLSVSLRRSEQDRIAKGEMMKGDGETHNEGDTRQNMDQ